MPRKSASKSPEKKDKDRLTLSQLANYDDVLTDALIDRAFYWSRIRKNRTKYFPIRGVHEDDITRILLHDVIVEKDSTEAEEHLLSLNGLRKYVSNLKTEKEKDNFKRHLRKYIAMYMPDSPFEVSTTNRYTITTQEACIVARRRIKRGETIKNLCGTLVAVTPEEEKDLDLTKRNFSIVISTRKKTSSIFLGPARFANHDCEANGRLKTTGSDGMEVVAARNIDIGEEITVSYGEGYFGPNNEECLCASCESGLRNGWAQVDNSACASRDLSPPASEKSIKEDGRSSSKKRQLEQESSSEVYSSATSNASKRRKLGDLLQPVMKDPQQPTPPSSFDSTSEDFQENNDSLKLTMSLLAAKRKWEDSKEIPTPESMDFPLSQEAPESHSMTYQPPKKRRRLIDLMVETSPTSTNGSDLWCDSAIDTHNQLSPTHSDKGQNKREVEAPTLTEVKIQVKTEHVPDETQDPFSVRTMVNADHDEKAGQLETPASTQSPIEAASLHKMLGDDYLPEPQQVQQPSPVPSPQKVVKSVEVAPSIASPSKGNLNAPASLNLRVPGDYKLTSRLIAQPYDRWVNCRTCESTFVQENGYQTRRECPRCERHSKLYGFGWPKTEREGRKDREERVMDHRTVHRFIGPEDERQVKRRGKGVISFSHESSLGAQSLTPERGSIDRGSSEVSEGGKIIRRSRRNWRITL